MSTTDTDRIPLLLIHGAWLSARSWERFEEFFERRGYAASAPEWPRKDGDVEAQADGCSVIDRVVLNGNRGAGTAVMAEDPSVVDLPADHRRCGGQERIFPLGVVFVVAAKLDVVGATVVIDVGRVGAHVLRPHEVDDRAQHRSRDSLGHARVSLPRARPLRRIVRAVRAERSTGRRRYYAGT